MDDLTRRHAVCASCSAPYPAATGVCPACGAPPVQTTGGAGYQVVVPQIPAMKQRAELARHLDEMFDCGGDVDATAETLGRGDTVVCTGISRESALALVEHLKRQHVSAKAEPAGAGAATSPTKLVAGAALTIVGVLLLIVTSGALQWGGGGAALLAGLVVLALHALSRPRKTSPLCIAPAPVTAMDGWETLPTTLTRLLVSLAGPAREALSAAAMDVAWLQDELRSESMAAYAAGGPGGTLDAAAQRLLAATIAYGRQIADGVGDEAEVTRNLQTLAATASKARKQLVELDAQAAGPDAIEPGAEVKQLTAGIELELQQASEAVAALQER